MGHRRHIARVHMALQERREDGDELMPMAILPGPLSKLIVDAIAEQEAAEGKCEDGDAGDGRGVAERAHRQVAAGAFGRVAANSRGTDMLVTMAAKRKPSR